MRWLRSALELDPLPTESDECANHARVQKNQLAGRTTLPRATIFFARALTCNRLRVRLQMPTEGPCRVDGCTDPDNSSGQWQYIPEKYCLEHDNLEYRKSCVCKKPACHRRCGLKPEKQIPGRKRKADDFVSLGVALEEQRELPRPPIIASIMEIWNERCAASCPCPPAILCHADCSGRRAAALCFMMDGRCVDLGPLGEEKRGNKLPHARSKHLEFAVQGKWRRSEDDENGTYGTWYISVRELVETFGAETVEAKLSEFAAAQAAARQEALASAIAGMATEATPV